MKKILFLAFVFATFLLGCSADGWFDVGSDPEYDSCWGEECNTAGGGGGGGNERYCYDGYEGMCVEIGSTYGGIRVTEDLCEDYGGEIVSSCF